MSGYIEWLQLCFENVKELTTNGAILENYGQALLWQLILLATIVVPFALVILLFIFIPRKIIKKEEKVYRTSLANIYKNGGSDYLLSGGFLGPVSVRCLDDKGVEETVKKTSRKIKLFVFSYTFVLSFLLFPFIATFCNSLSMDSLVWFVLAFGLAVIIACLLVVFFRGELLIKALFPDCVGDSNYNNFHADEPYGLDYWNVYKLDDNYILFFEGNYSKKELWRDFEEYLRNHFNYVPSQDQTYKQNLIRLKDNFNEVYTNWRNTYGGHKN